MYGISALGVRLMRCCLEISRRGDLDRAYGGVADRLSKWATVNMGMVASLFVKMWGERWGRPIICQFTLTPCGSLSNCSSVMKQSAGLTWVNDSYNSTSQMGDI